MNKDQLRQLIAADQLREVLQNLSQIAKAKGNKKLTDDVVIQQGRLKNLENETHRGIIDKDDADIARAKIRSAILYFIDELPGTELSEPENAAAQPDGKQASESSFPKKKTPSSLPSHFKPPLILGVFFTLLILGLIVFIPCPSEKQFDVFHTILSISVAGLAAVIPGFLQVKFKNIVTAGGALAVFALVFLGQPEHGFAESKCGETTTPFTIKIEKAAHLENIDLSNYPPLSADAVLKIWQNNEWKKSEIRNGAADFKNLDAALKGQKLDLDLEAPYWTLAKVSDSIFFEGKSQVAFILPNGRLKDWKGKVLDANTLEPLNGAVIELENLSDTTDGGGFFHIEIPGEMQRTSHQVTMRKEGYETHRPFVMPDPKIQEYRLKKKQ